MNGLMKVLTGILGIMAVIACLATVGVIGYALSGGGNGSGQQTDRIIAEVTPTPVTPEETPTTIPPLNDGIQGQVINLADHIHNYEESVDIKATCYQAGRLLYTCSECGDYYYVDVHSTGHVPDDWEILREPTATEDGIRVQRCIYCDEIVAQESLVYEGEDSDSNSTTEVHVHDYTAAVDREPSCILAGLRRYTCSCGDFYTEPIPAKGHVATDWTEVEAATTTMLGREQRTCTVCGVVLDSRPIAALTPSPSPSSGANASSGATTAPTTASTTAPTASSTASAQASASPSATPHTHNFASYVIKEANCQEKGIRSFVCSGCGNSYAEEIDLDLNNHTYQAIVFPPTNATMGYTMYRCVRCNYSYIDNYVPALGGR